MIVETSAGRDPSIVRKILGGTGMVTPTCALEVRYDGRRERLTPGVTRMVPEHALVRSRPEAFCPCDASDSATRDRLRSMSGRTATRTAARPRTTAGGLNLPGTTFRLPRSVTSGPVLPTRVLP